MKKLVVFLILTALAFTSCSSLDSIEICGEDNKSEYSHHESYKTYIVNTATMSYHKSTCHIAKRINEENRWEVYDEDFLKERGYKKCGVCFK